ncbi:MAG TPA: helix-turn-helix domain-containing protein [Nocardioides sp.]|nr:helix-turn-helix domain-containing protein [Nocardioides sp.]
MPAKVPSELSGERLWTAGDVAAYLGVPVKTIHAWRSRGRGPKGFRAGKHLRWHAATVFEWSLDQERNQ